MISLTDMTASRGNFQLSIDSLDLKAGDFIAVLGNNGSGKSTFLSALSGFLETEGQYQLNGQPFDSYSLKEKNRLIGLLPQKTALNMPFDVRYVILTGRYPLTNGYHYRDEDIQATESIIQQFDIDHLADRAFNQLSGGEKQRVLLARALNRETPIHLLDEPMTGIDIRHQHETVQLLKRQTKDRIFLVVMHDISMAISEFQRYLIFDNGKLVYDVNKDQIDEKQLEKIFNVKIKFLTHKEKLIVYSALDSP